jgi:hypothetical protein
MDDTILIGGASTIIIPDSSWFKMPLLVPLEGRLKTKKYNFLAGMQAHCSFNK